jgi:hypothetical protein
VSLRKAINYWPYRIVYYPDTHLHADERRLRAQDSVWHRAFLPHAELTARRLSDAWGAALVPLLRHENEVVRRLRAPAYMHAE